jgi:hypothetical protein
MSPSFESGLIIALFDVDGDGKLNREEFKELFKFFRGKSPQTEGLNSVWSDIDSERTGAISREEYESWMGRRSGGIVARSSQRPDPFSMEFHNLNEIYKYLQNFKNPVDPRPRWFPRHHVTANLGPAVHPSIRGYFGRRQSEWCTREGRERLYGFL